MPGTYPCLHCWLLWDGAQEKLLGLHLATLVICCWQWRPGTFIQVHVIWPSLDWLSQHSHKSMVGSFP